MESNSKSVMKQELELMDVTVLKYIRVVPAVKKNLENESLLLFLFLCIYI